MALMLLPTSLIHQVMEMLFESEPTPQATALSIMAAMTEDPGLTAAVRIGGRRFIHGYSHNP